MRKNKKNRKLRQTGNKTFFSKLTFHKLGWLEWISVALSLWFWIYPHPYKVLFTLLLLMPIIGLVLNGLNGRPSIATLVEISQDSNGEDEYDVADFIDLPAFAILIRVLLDFEFEDYYSLILPGTIAFILMLLFLFLTHNYIINTRKSKWWIYSSLLFSICLYSYSGTYGINCAFDNSIPEVYSTQVLDKRISVSRRSRIYYIKVKPWGVHKESEEISVPASQYGDIQIGESVNIDLKQGVFNIPWYYIE